MDILKNNGLDYSINGKKNVFQERTLKTNYSQAGQSGTYQQNDTMIFNLKTGYDYINAKNSTLVFKIKTRKTDPLDGKEYKSYLIGSILNVIKTSITYTKNKKEIDRLENLNLLNFRRISDDHTETKNRISEALMLSKTDIAGSLTSNSPINFTMGENDIESAYKEVAIPLYFLSSLFTCEKLLPPQLTDGMTIQLILEKYIIAFVDPTGNEEDVDYLIYDVHMRLDSYSLEPSLFKSIDMSEGIPFRFSSYYTINNSFDAKSASQIALEFRRSASLAQSAKTIRRDAPLANSLDTNSFSSRKLTETNKSLWRVGNVAYPRTQLEGKVQHYMNTVYCNNQLLKYGHDDQHQEYGINLNNYAGSDTKGDINYGHSTYDVNFLRNPENEFSGVKLNDTSVLTLNLDDEDIDIGTVITTFIKHMRNLVITKDDVKLYI
jgi:hypothetical protein